MSLNQKQYEELISNNLKVLLNEYYHSETGESISENEIELLVKGITSGELDLIGSNLEVCKGKGVYYKYTNDKRRFLKVLITDFSNLEINYKEEGIISRLSKNLRHDGSGIVEIDGVYSITSLAKYFGVKYATLNNILKKLKNKNIINYEKNKNVTTFYLNPDIIRYGNIITEKLKIMFNIKNDYISIIKE